MKIEISKYCADDKQNVFEIYQQILTKEWKTKNEPALLEQEFDEALQEEQVYVARIGVEIVGFISWFEPDAFIHHLYVKKGLRRQKVGLQILQFALNRMRYPIRLKCLQENQNAIDFYLANDWYMVGEGESDEGDFYIMEYSKIEAKVGQVDNFKLHERLQNDCYRLGKLPFCHLLLMKNAQVPWFILVPETLKVEIHDLNIDSQRKMMGEVTEVSLMLKNIFKVDKVNLGAIGNLVPQLHFHVIGRQVNDYCWPKVVWGAEGFREYEAEELNKVVGLVKASFRGRLH